MTNYNKGLHIIADIKTKQSNVLVKGELFEEMLRQNVVKSGLHIVGIVCHNFESGGFTIAVCLTESHICAHTWPEFGIVTLDIYLSNTYSTNDEKGRFLLEECKKYFKPDSITVKEILR